MLKLQGMVGHKYVPMIWNKMSHFCKSVLPIGLCLLISLNGFLPAASAQNLPTQLNIIVVDGDGATSPVHQHTTRDPVVKIEDDDHQPIAGASVVFALPVSGTSGEFSNGSQTLVVTTDKDGQAAARGLRVNDIPGRLQISVIASFRGLRGRALINQNVEAPPGTKVTTPDIKKSGGSGSLKWIILGVIAAGGAGAGIYLAHRGGSTASTPTPSGVSISIGTVSFGSPR